MAVKIKAAETKSSLEDGEFIEAVDEALMEAIEKMAPGNGNVTISIEIENDLEPEEDEDEESSED